MWVFYSILFRGWGVPSRAPGSSPGPGPLHRMGDPGAPWWKGWSSAFRTHNPSKAALSTGGGVRTTPCSHPSLYSFSCVERRYYTSRVRTHKPSHRPRPGGSSPLCRRLPRSGACTELGAGAQVPLKQGGPPSRALPTTAVSLSRHLCYNTQVPGQGEGTPHSRTLPSRAGPVCSSPGDQVSACSSVWEGQRGVPAQVSGGEQRTHSPQRGLTC